MSKVINQQIKLLSKSMKLSAFQAYEQVLRDSIDNKWSYEEFLLHLLQTEAQSRKQNKLLRYKRQAKFPFEKSLEEFELSKLQHIEPTIIFELSSCDFIKKKENIILIGNPGTGKTHLSIALGLKACLNGLRVLFTTAANLATELIEAESEQRLGKLIKQLSKIDLLILDELSYLSFNKYQSELLFQVISERSERGSLIISTNLEFSKWEDLFPDTLLTNALIDRVTFNSHILNMNGDSYRLSKSLD
ncbi:IS21-like element helper ATPase IstB [Fusibacter paucivorans]|jgi:DNA replication protein DnaC|uniref:IS21-like element helper ATPase IstB n=1 Tax=Fusibacter paucivorans TaxID=76009 RepID=A0ABS5PTG0_9FIRM|nr:IS21-like element helper ATPase IstB [Fusibacter paucivorans]MBS7528458.1 IS21-like element helper ATPase IstB [Fusibacter paucivorans]